MGRWCATMGAHRREVTGIGNINTRGDFKRYLETISE